MSSSHDVILRREKSSGTSVEIIQVVSIEGKVLLEPSASTFCELDVFGRENALVELDTV